MIETVKIEDDGKVLLIDQRILPTEEKIVVCTTLEEVAEAIKNMTVRGAPAIGVTAAGGAALGAASINSSDTETFKKAFSEMLDILAATRPTAVNLFWAIKRMRQRVLFGNATVDDMKQAAKHEARLILEEDIAINEQMGKNGAELLADGDVILTHCNAGALATAGHYGTALGVIKAAHLSGKQVSVFADETRPFLQGARLTAWEMMKEGIDVTLITDSMAGYFMQQGKITKVVVGADRIAANGDAANKIGTYSVAVLAHRHKIPFYITAPLSTIDFDTADGSGIPIEQRDEKEITHIKGQQVAPSGVKVLNPAFDVTPKELISAIITERGIATAPFNLSLQNLR